MLPRFVLSLDQAVHSRLVVVSKLSTLPGAISHLQIKFIQPLFRLVAPVVMHSVCLLLAGGTHFHDDYSPGALRTTICDAPLQSCHWNK